jgi:hypothetical protein
MRVALLPRLDGVEWVHEQVSRRSSNATSNHGLIKQNESRVSNFRIQM